MFGIRQNAWIQCRWAYLANTRRFFFLHIQWIHAVSGHLSAKCAVQVCSKIYVVLHTLWKLLSTSLEKAHSLVLFSAEQTDNKETVYSTVCCTLSRDTPYKTICMCMNGTKFHKNNFNARLTTKLCPCILRVCRMSFFCKYRGEFILQNI